MSSLCSYKVDISLSNCSCFADGPETVKCGYFGFENGADTFTFSDEGFSITLSRYQHLYLEHVLVSKDNSLLGQIVKGLVYTIALSPTLPSLRSISLVKTSGKRRSKPEMLFDLNQPIACGDSFRFASEKRPYPFTRARLAAIFGETRESEAVRSALARWLAAVAEPNRRLMLLKLRDALDILCRYHASKAAGFPKLRADLPVQSCMAALADFVDRNPELFPRTLQRDAARPRLLPALERTRSLSSGMLIADITDSSMRLIDSEADIEIDRLNTLLRILVYELIINHPSL